MLSFHYQKERNLNMEQLNLWRERIKDRESSGLTVKDWCSKNGINPATYASWKTKVKKTGFMVYFRSHKTSFRKLQNTGCKSL